MRSDVVKAIVLAAGEGTRLRPLTMETPKVLLPVDGVCLMEHTLNWLKGHGISEVAINLYHLGEKIRDFLGDGSRFGMKISYSPEATLLGTAGGVKKMESSFSNTFIVVYGDVLTTFDLGAMLRFHKAKSSLATLAIGRVSNPWDFGIVEMNAEGRILGFVEKPPRGTEKGNLGNSGVYIFETGIFSYIPDRGAADFAYDVFPRLVASGLPAYGYLLKPEDYFIDIGTIERYYQANEDAKAGKVKIK